MNQFKVVDTIFWGVAFAIFLNALQAYSIFSIPVSWIGNALIVLLSGFFILVERKFSLFRGAQAFLFFSLWVVVDFLTILVAGPPAPESPAKATLGYYPYVSLRFFNIFACGITIFLVYWLICRGKKNQIINFCINLGLVISLYSIYVYYAQLHGLPEIPRTRLGTSGEAQATAFTYAFHRAMGTFREPSHFAEWLLLPLFLSLYKSKNVFNYKTLIIALALAMTGSLTGIAGFFGGSLIAVLLCVRLNTKVVMPALKIISLAVVAGIIFAFFVTIKSGEKESSVAGILWSRLAPIAAEGGLRSSNRDYVYYYLDRKPFTIFGDGVGNPNIEFSKFIGSEATASFLSLYITTLYSAGYIGFILLILFLMSPVFVAFKSRKQIDDNQFFYLAAAYLGWLIIFSIHSEELNLQFGICYAVVVGTLQMELNEKKDFNSL